MPSNQGLAVLLGKLFGRRGAPTPANLWLARRATANPEEVIREHFAAINAHDLDWIVATLAPERARLYYDHTTVDKRRQSIKEATLVDIKAVDVPIEMPAFAQRYRTHGVFQVEYELKLVEPEQRRDPAVQEGRQWAYYVLLMEAKGKPWLIADWGRT